MKRCLLIANIEADTLKAIGVFCNMLEINRLFIQFE